MYTTLLLMVQQLKVHWATPSVHLSIFSPYHTRSDMLVLTTRNEEMKTARWGTLTSAREAGIYLPWIDRRLSWPWCQLYT